MPSRPTSRSHTQHDRVARPRLGSIAPTATAGGDALPLHDTTAPANIDWTFSPTRPPTHTLHPVDDETVLLGELEPTATRHTEPAIVRSREVVRIRGTAWRHWIPWSIAVGVAAVVAVRLAVGLSGSAGSVLAATATGSVMLCAVLLVAAQAVEATRR